MPTYYATLDWTYPEGERTPLGFEVAAYLSSGGSPNAPLALRQKTFNGRVVDASVSLNNLPQGTYNSVPMSGGYGANCICSVVVNSSSVITSVTINEGGDLYRVGDELVGTVTVQSVEKQFYLQVTQVGFKVVYTTESSSPIKMAVRTVFSNGKSDWVQSSTLTPP
jgi:hypothetical protein